jgi:hypothetical protein
MSVLLRTARSSARAPRWRTTPAYARSTLATTPTALTSASAMSPLRHSRRRCRSPARRAVSSPLEPRSALPLADMGGHASSVSSECPREHERRCRAVLGQRRSSRHERDHGAFGEQLARRPPSSPRTARRPVAPPTSACGHQSGSKRRRLIVALVRIACPRHRLVAKPMARSLASGRAKRS